MPNKISIWIAFLGFFVFASFVTNQKMIFLVRDNYAIHTNIACVDETSSITMSAFDEIAKEIYESSNVQQPQNIKRRKFNKDTILEEANGEKELED